MKWVLWFTHLLRNFWLPDQKWLFHKFKKFIIKKLVSTDSRIKFPQLSLMTSFTTFTNGSSLYLWNWSHHWQFMIGVQGGQNVINFCIVKLKNKEMKGCYILYLHCNYDGSKKVLKLHRFVISSVITKMCYLKAQWHSLLK